jgi:tRNA(fMet)-specific endonuclease VapC
LLDTNICIYIIKKRPVDVFEKFRTLPLGSVGISTITLAEMEYGVVKSSQPEKNNEVLIRFITPLEIIPFNHNAALHYGAIRLSLEKQGTPIGAMDILIASQAMSMNTTLITNNEKEFIRIKGLKVENWVK